MVKGIVRACVAGIALCFIQAAGSAQDPLPLSTLTNETGGGEPGPDPETDPMHCQLQWLVYWEKLSRGVPAIPPECIP